MRSIYSRGVYEANTIRHIVAMIKSGRFGEEPVFIDVGANIGAYSLVLAKLAPAGTVYAFEPNSKALRYLKNNILLNDLRNVLVFEHGLSNITGEAVLFNDSMTQASIHKKGADGKCETIELKRLDDVCLENRINKVDLIKIDVEGHDLEVLKGADQIIRENPRLVVVLEIDSNAELTESKEKLFDYMLSLGFTAHLPKGFPFSMRRVVMLPSKYADNVIFIRDKMLG